MTTLTVQRSLPKLGGFTPRLIGLELRRMVRNRRTVVFTLIMPAVFFLLFGTNSASKTQAAGLKGDLKVFVGNRRFSGDPRTIVLKPHELITIEQGKVVEPPPFSFPPGV